MTIIIPQDRSKLSRKGDNRTAVNWTQAGPRGLGLAATSSVPSTQGSQKVLKASCLCLSH